jgi:iron complex transport system ATP-binding protein
MYGDRILLLKEGRIASLGSPHDVLTGATLESVYDCRIVMDKSPVGDFPRLTVKPGKYDEKMEKLS